MQHAELLEFVAEVFSAPICSQGLDFLEWCFYKAFEFNEVGEGLGLGREGINPRLAGKIINKGKDVLTVCTSGSGKGPAQITMN